MATQPETVISGQHLLYPAANKDTGQIDTLIADALELHQSQLRQRLSLMFDNAADNLIALLDINPQADPADEDTEDDNDTRIACFDALIQNLRSERDNIEAAFFQAISQHTTKAPRTNDATASDGLSLIDQSEMDEMVAVTAMYTNAMNKYGEEVNNLASRFEHLETSSNRTFPKHVFDLRHICEAFQTALTQAGLPTDHKLLVFKLFDRDVSSCLEKMYKTLNQFLINAGVLPEVVYTVNKQEPATPAADSDSAGAADDTHPTADSADSTSGNDDSGNNASGGGLSGSLNAAGNFFSQFMSGIGTAKGNGIPQSFFASPADTDSDACYSRDDLMDALSELQNDLADTDSDDAPAMDAEHIKRAVMTSMGRGNGGAITRTVRTQDQRYIDFVGMIFQEIADDESISAVITNLLMRLQIPIIKIAMIDERLFAYDNHPARMTLDLITRAGRGIAETTDRVFIDLKTIVSEILQSREQDSSSFEKAVDVLQALVKKQEEFAARKEQEEQREIIRQHARHVVLAEIRQISKYKVIPEENRPLMLKYWPSLMFNHYFKHGIESSEWLLSVSLFKRLMESLQPVTSWFQWKKLNANHASLVAAVSEELYRTRQPREEIDAHIQKLKQTLVELLENSQYRIEPDPLETYHAAIDALIKDADETPVETAEQEDTGDEDKAASIEEQVRIAREKIARLPGNLHPGVWFEVFDGEDSPVRRLKLSVILTDVARLVFVDRHGVQVIEKDADDFLHELNNGQSKPIADHSTFERALGSVIHKFAP